MKSTTKKIYSHLTDSKTMAAMRIQSKVLEVVHKQFRKDSFIEIPPVIATPLTDPLAHSVHKSDIFYEGQKLSLTKSMIFHKQLALIGKGNKKIYIVSPNIRLEKSFEAKSRHLLEFQQIDFEIYKAKKKDVYDLMEKLLVEIVKSVKKDCAKELKLFKRKLEVPKRPFPVYKTYELEEKYGENFEEIMSKKSKTPFWLESFYREFYDKEDPKKRGEFINYDLIYPEGFEEGLSGGEREHEYKVILRKMKERKMDLSPYKIYLDLAKNGKIPQSAGAGFGVQRLLRYLTGERKIEKMCLFPRSPREKIIF
ncbi:MAG: asparagine synthetase A [bacterium]